MIQYTVDRIEEWIVVCENRETKEMVSIAIQYLPKEIKAGDILIFEDGKYRIDEEETNFVAKRIKKKMEDLWE